MRRQHRNRFALARKLVLVVDTRDGIACLTSRTLLRDPLMLCLGRGDEAAPPRQEASEPDKNETLHHFLFRSCQFSVDPLISSLKQLS